MKNFPYAMLLSGIIAAVQSLYFATANNSGITFHEGLNALLMFLLGVSHFIPGYIGTPNNDNDTKPPTPPAPPTSFTASLFIAALFLASLSGCAVTPGLAVAGHVDPSGAISGDVTFTLKDQLQQAIVCEKAAIEQLKNTYFKMRNDQANDHRVELKKHTDRLNKLLSGQYVPPVDEPSIPVTSAPLVITPAPLPPAVFLPEPGSPNGSSVLVATNTRKALLIGINKYPGAPLHGCVNDVLNVKKLLIEKYGYLEADIVVLLDEEATTERINAELDKLTIGVKDGDQRVFWASGHGAKYPGADGKIYHIFCPVEFDWTETHMITNTQFREKFSRLPLKSICNWGSDSCFSGKLNEKKIGLPAAAAVAKVYPFIPKAIAQRIEEIEIKKALAKRDMPEELNLGYISGCSPDQTSADTVDANGKPCGAMTDAFIQEIRKPGAESIPVTELVERMNKCLEKDGYDQKPEAGGAQKNKPFQRSENILRIQPSLWIRNEIWYELERLKKQMAA